MLSVVEITRDPIDLGPLVRRLTTSECGACLTFLGVVRDHADGRAVESIDYTCYESMARSELEALTSRMAERHGVTNVAVIHRIGRLAVGEASLGVVVASAHRREAFHFAMELIDELKKSVPIWKREFGPDGANWV